MVIGIVGAMKEEIILLKNELEDVKEHKVGVRTYYEGYYNGICVVMCLSGWGKVAAASVSDCMINKFGAKSLVFIGLAGSMSKEVKIGDVVVATKLIQHDVDLREFSMLGEIEPPFYKSFSFDVDVSHQEISYSAVTDFVNNLNKGSYTHISKEYKPKVHMGEIGTGDQFVGSPEMKNNIIKRYPNLLCTEMEGAAIAQVANDYCVPCSVIRIISDNAEDGAHATFVEFLFEEISHISVEIIKILIPKLK